MRKSHWLLIGILLPLLANAAVTDEQYAKFRAAAHAKHRKIIIDNDGCDVTAFPESKKVSLENIVEHFNGKALGYEIDAISYSSGGVSFKMTYRTKVSDRHYVKMHVRRLNNMTKWTHEQGTDGLQMAIDFSRKHGYEIFANMRINDLHDRWAPADNYAPFMLAHPHWLVGSRDNAPPFGSWLQYNFAVPEIRERFLAIVEEQLRYDVDGMIIDLCRTPVLFPGVANGGKATPEECAIITQLMRDLRQMCDRIGKEKGKYQMLIIKVPDGIELNLGLGIDIDTICKEKLIDFMIVGSDIGKADTYANAVKMGRKYGIKTYLSVEAWNGANRLSKDSEELYRGMAAAAWHAKPDGIFYFNMFYHSSKFGAIKRDPADLLMTDKSYWGRHHRRPDYAGFCTDHAKLIELDGTDIVIDDKSDARVLMETGAEFGRNDVAAKNPTVELIFHTAPGIPALKASINGHELGEPLVYYKKQVFSVPYKFVRPGENMITLRATKKFDAPMDILFRGDKILRSPWRRLWPYFKSGVTEKIVDGAIRVNDQDKGKGQCINFYYPISATAKDLSGEFEMMFEKSDTPEAVVFRIANGRKVELVTFEKNKVTFKYAGKSAVFNTADKFHTYSWKVLKNDVFELSVDGKLLLSAPMKMDANNPACRFGGNVDGLPYMFERSIFIGSITEAGTGVSLWKNFKMSQGIAVKGTELSITFNKKSDALLRKAAGQFKNAKKVLSYVPGGSNSTWRSGYPEGGLTVTPEKTLVMNNDAGENKFATVNHNIPKEFSAKGMVAVLHWQSKVHQSKEYGFATGIRFKNPADGKNYMLYTMQKPELLLCAAGPATAVINGNEFVDCKIFIELDTANYIFIINNRIIDAGTLKEVKASPLLYFGDSSSVCDGKAELKFMDVYSIDTKSLK